MKKGLLLPLSVALLLSLAACNNGKKPESESKTESETSEVSESGDGYAVRVTNVADLTAAWRVGDADRTLEIETTPEANVAQLLYKGELVVASSNTEVVTVTPKSKVIQAVGAGTATISVTWTGHASAVASFEVEVAAKVSNKEKYGIAHEGTEADPLDNEDAVKVGLYAKDNGDPADEFYIKGEVAEFYHAPGERIIDGVMQVSYYLKAAEEGGTRFEVYCASKEDKSDISVTELFVGGIATAKGRITYYAKGNQPETTGKVIFLGCEGEAPAAPETHEVTFAEALAAGLNVASGKSTYDYYQFDAYVVKHEGNDYYVNATNEVAEDNKSMIEIYYGNTAVEEADAKLLKGALVTLKMTLKNYKGQVENGTARPEITVKTPGGAWKEEVEYDYSTEFNVVTLAAAKAATPEDGSESAKMMVVGHIAKITSTKYGNGELKNTNEPDEMLTIYGMYDVDGNRYDAMAVKPGEDDVVVLEGAFKNFTKDGVVTWEIVNAVVRQLNGEVCLPTEDTSEETSEPAESEPASEVPGSEAEGIVSVTKTAKQLGTQNNLARGSAIPEEGLDVDEVITFKFVGNESNGAKYYEDDIRVYIDKVNDQGEAGTGLFSIEAAEGYELVSINVTFTWNKGLGTIGLTSGQDYDLEGRGYDFRLVNEGANSEQWKPTSFTVVYRAA